MKQELLPERFYFYTTTPFEQLRPFCQQFRYYHNYLFGDQRGIREGYLIQGRRNIIEVLPSHYPILPYMELIEEKEFTNLAKLPCKKLPLVGNFSAYFDKRTQVISVGCKNIALESIKNLHSLLNNQEEPEPYGWVIDECMEFKINYDENVCSLISLSSQYDESEHFYFSLDDLQNLVNFVMNDEEILNSFEK